jgi:hypothetical protein
MSTLALVYVELTKHVVSSVLVQSGRSASPTLEELVGAGPHLRDAPSGAVAVNVASTALDLKVLTLDTAAFANDHAKLDGLLGNPLAYCLQLTNPADPTSLAPTLAQPTTGAAGLTLTNPLVPGAGNTVALKVAAPTPLDLVVLVQRGAIDASPIAAPKNTVGPALNPASSLQVSLQSKDWVLVLVGTFQPMLKGVP